MTSRHSLACGGPRSRDDTPPSSVASPSILSFAQSEKRVQPASCGLGRLNHVPPKWMQAGALGGIRTPDPQIRSLVLYPAELRAPQAFLTKSAFEFHLSFARHTRVHAVTSRQAARDERHPPSPPARIDPRV